MVRRHPRAVLCSVAIVVLLLVTGGSCVRLVQRAENASPGTYTEMEDVCEALRTVPPFIGLIGDAMPQPGGDGGNCEWLPTDTPGRVAITVQTVLHQGPVIENTNEHVKALVDANTCADSCPPQIGRRDLLDISVAHQNSGGITSSWLGCGQAINPNAVRYFGFFWHDNIVMSITIQTRWRVPAARLAGLVTDPSGPLRAAFQTAYLTFTHNENLTTPAPLRTPGRRSGCDR